MPMTRVAQVLRFPPGTAPVPEPPLTALVVVQVLAFSFIPVEISSADPTSDSQIVSVIQISPAMQKCLSLDAVWHDSSLRAEQELQLPAQLVTDYELGVVVVVCPVWALIT